MKTLQLKLLSFTTLRCLLVLFLVFFTTALFSQNEKQAITTLSLDEVFVQPPVSTKPSVYWYWISNNISREGIKKDLQAMANIGIGGVNIAQISYKDSPVGNVPMFGNQWWDCMTFAMEEAARLGIQVQIHPVPTDEVKGFAADILSKEAIQASFDAYIGQILKRIPPEKRKTLTNIVLDSYEQGSANWTDGLAQKFNAAYGYDPMPWTPVLKGHLVESVEQSDRFLWDLRRLVADLLPQNFPGALQEKSRHNGLTLWHEPYAGHGFPGEFFNMGKYTDIPAGEFWVTSTPGAGFSYCRAASSVARANGRNIVSAEAFTSQGIYLYKMLPRDMKILGDWAFAQGINHFTFHVSVHQPNDSKPGINTWYGTEFNRNNNWFQDAGTYIDYIKRTSALLQRGQRQTDLAFYIGDDVPCDKPILPYTLPQGYDFDCKLKRTASYC